jgi:MFS family permease
MAIPVGSALGYVLGGQIAERAGWRWAFYAVVPPGLLLGAVCFLMRDPPRGIADADAAAAAAGAAPAPAPPAKRPRVADYLQLFRIRSYVLDCAGMTLMTFAIGGISFWMPRYISEVRQAGTLAHVNSVFGVITVLSGISATLLGGIAGDALRPRFPGSYFLVSGVGILIACPAVVTMLILPFPAAWAAVFVAEFFLFFNTGPSNTILANVTHPSVRATAFALNILLIHALGDALSPPVLGHIAERFSWNTAFALVVLAMGMAAVIWLIGAKYLERDTARASGAPAETRGFPIEPRQNATGDAPNVS